MEESGLTRREISMMEAEASWLGAMKHSCAGERRCHAGPEPEPEPGQEPEPGLEPGRGRSRSAGRREGRGSRTFQPWSLTGSVASQVLPQSVENVRKFPKFTPCPHSPCLQPCWPKVQLARLPQLQNARSSLIWMPTAGPGVAPG